MFYGKTLTRTQVVSEFRRDGLKVGEVGHLNHVGTVHSNAVQFRSPDIGPDANGVCFDVVLAHLPSLYRRGRGVTGLSVCQHVQNVLSIRAVAKLVEDFGPGKI